MSLAVRNEEECVDALVQALEATYPDLEVTVLVLRLIAKFVRYRKLADAEKDTVDTRPHCLL